MLRASSSPYLMAARVLLVVLTLSLLLTGPRPVQGSPAAEPQTPVAPTVFVAQSGPPVSPNGMLVQWMVPDFVVTLVVTRNSRKPNDPLFKSWGPLGGGQRQLLDTDVQPGQSYEYQVCAGYSGPVYMCSNWVASSMATAGGTGGAYIDSYKADVTWIGIGWHTRPSQYYNKFEIRYHAKPLPGEAMTPFLTDTEPDDGDWGYREIRGLEPNTTYFFAVRGYDAVNAQWSSWGPEFQASTLPAPDMIDRPKPEISFKESGDTWISVSWRVDYGPVAAGRGKYAKFIISYRIKPGANGAPTPEMKDVEDGVQGNHTINDLKPGTTYIIYVQGCNLNLGLNGPPGDDCAMPGSEVEVTTKTPTAPLGPLVAALLDVSQPTVTAGNTVTVKGSAWTVTGDVALTLVGPKGSKTSVNLGKATISKGGFSSTVTIPAGTAAGSYKIHAQATGQQNDVDLQVLAPSKQGTLTATSGGLVYTAIDLDYPFTLTGVNFTPGPVTIYVDSSSGPQIGTATVKADGTFQVDITVKSSLGTPVKGAHKIVAVQSGNVAGSLDVTFSLPEVIH